MSSLTSEARSLAMRVISRVGTASASGKRMVALLCRKPASSFSSAPTSRAVAG
jgi:hypothetical protein